MATYENWRKVAAYVNDQALSLRIHKHLAAERGSSFIGIEFSYEDAQTILRVAARS